MIKCHLKVQVFIPVLLRLKYSYELPEALTKMQIIILWRLSLLFEKLLGCVYACVYPLSGKDIGLSFVKKLVFYKSS